MIEVDSFLIENAAELGVNPEYVNPGSVDICLGEHIIERQPHHEDIHHYLGQAEPFLFQPSRLYIAHSLEYVRIPPTHRAQVLCKSSTARNGLNHLMAGLLDGGFHGQVTYEFVAYMPVEFRQAQRIVQLEFARYSQVPDRHYGLTGRYNGQKGATLARPERE